MLIGWGTLGMDIALFLHFMVAILLKLIGILIGFWIIGFVPFVQIVNIRITENIWMGTRLELLTTQGKEMLTMPNVLSRKEKQQIYQTIKRFGIRNPIEPQKEKGNIGY